MSILSSLATFQWQDPDIPFKELRHVLCSVVAYLAVVYSLKFLREGKPPLVFVTFSLVHNLVLSVFSLLVLLGLVFDLSALVSKHGFDPLWCDASRIGQVCQYSLLSEIRRPDDTSSGTTCWCYLTLLHVWHHVSTLVLMWAQLEFEVPVQWAGIVLNLAVHVLMYSYYAFRIMGYPEPWWKKWITVLQIAQFVLGLGVCVAALTWRRSARGLPCSGDPLALWFSLGILLSFLLLFVDFFREEYGKPKTSKPKSPNALKDR